MAIYDSSVVFMSIDSLLDPEIYEIPLLFNASNNDNGNKTSEGAKKRRKTYDDGEADALANNANLNVNAN